MSTTIIHGDCLEELKKLEDNSIDAVVCDPPYGLSNTKPAQVADVLKAWVTGDTEAAPTTKGGFMNASWDSFVPPPAVWEECMRVLKPGGHMAVFAGARTQDLMGLSIRLAGFEIRDTLGWVYGSGMPKSLDVSKAIDKARREDAEPVKAVAKALREALEASGKTRKEIDAHFGTANVSQYWFSPHRNSQVPPVDKWPWLRDFLGIDSSLDAEVWRLNGRKGTPGEAWEKREVVGAGFRIDRKNGAVPYGSGTETGHYDITAPATDEAKQWDGWGTALKPAIEPILLCRKPLDGTVANNVLAHGVGGLNIDACRVSGEGLKASDYDDSRRSAPKFSGILNGGKEGAYRSRTGEVPSGRFPANVLLDEHAAKEMDEQSGVLKSGGGNKAPRSSTSWFTSNSPNVDDVRNPDSGGASRFFPVFKSEEETPETKGRFPANVLLDEHAAAEMDEQSGVLKSGGANKGVSGSPGSATGFSRGGEFSAHTDSGGASRFFPVFKYQAKAPKKERPVIEREDGTKIQHPTVKPLTLLEWLVELITPPGGTVLDPFAGSGTTLQAALNKGFQPIGIEQDADYIKLIEQRLAA